MIYKCNDSIAIAIFLIVASLAITIMVVWKWYLRNRQYCAAGERLSMIYKCNDSIAIAIFLIVASLAITIVVVWKWYLWEVEMIRRAIEGAAKHVFG